MQRLLLRTIVRRLALAACLLLFSGAAIGTSTDEAAWKADLERWRAQREANLQKPEGWLSLIRPGLVAGGRQ